MDKRRTVLTLGALSALVVGLAAQPAMAQDEPLVVKGAFATEIVEPWDGVIHRALEAEQAAGRIAYTYQDDIGYEGDMEFVLTEMAETEHPAIIFGDAFGNEAAVRRVAEAYPDIAFVFGSEYGPVEPNVSVFDNWIHEPAYLAGMLAGGMTKTNVIGVVGGVPVAEVNRIVNAFTAGAQAQNPEATVLVTFINEWFNPVTAKEAALAQVAAGADVLYAERFGVIEAAAENGLLAVGNMSDQQSLGPDAVITSVLWDMTPTVDYVVDQVVAGALQAQDLKDFSMMLKGGASLAPINAAVGVPDDLAGAVAQREADIRAGAFRVPIDESVPANSTTVGG